MRRPPPTIRNQSHPTRSSCIRLGRCLSLFALMGCFLLISLACGRHSLKDQTESNIFNDHYTASHSGPFGDFYRPFYRPRYGPWEHYPGPWNPIHSIWISSFTASPSQVVRGQPTQISWNAPGAQTVYIDGVGGGYGPSGSISVTPQFSTTYQIHAYGFNGQQVSASAYVNVVEPPARILSFYVSPLQIKLGESVLLSWSVENCRTVQISSSGDPSGQGVYGCSGQIFAQPRSNTVYSLQAYGLDGQVAFSPSYSVYINLPPPNPRINFFRAHPLIITRGEASVLEWSVSDAQRVEIFGLNDLVQNVSGSIRIAPLESTTFRLRAYHDQGGIAESTLTVLVENPIPLPSIHQFDVTPPSVEKGNPVTLVWSVENCHDLEIEGQTQNPLPCQGSLNVYPQQSTHFRLVARNAKGQAVYKSVYLPVTQPPQWPVIWEFRSQSPEIFRGQSTLLSWQAAYASRLELIGPEFTLEEPANGQITVSPQVTTTYELRAYNVRNQMTSSFVTVNVRPPFRPSIEYFTSNQPISMGQVPLVLSWKGHHCVSTEIPGVLQPVFTSQGSYSYLPRQKVEKLILRCFGETGERVEASLTVGALPAGYSTDDAVNVLIGLMGGSQ